MINDSIEVGAIWNVYQLFIFTYVWKVSILNHLRFPSTPFFQCSPVHICMWNLQSWFWKTNRTRIKQLCKELLILEAHMTFCIHRRLFSADTSFFRGLCTLHCFKTGNRINQLNWTRFRWEDLISQLFISILWILLFCCKEAKSKKTRLTKSVWMQLYFSHHLLRKVDFRRLSKLSACKESKLMCNVLACKKQAGGSSFVYRSV